MESEEVQEEVNAILRRLLAAPTPAASSRGDASLDVEAEDGRALVQRVSEKPTTATTTTTGSTVVVKSKIKPASRPASARSIVSRPASARSAATVADSINVIDDLESHLNPEAAVRLWRAKCQSLQEDLTHAQHELAEKDKKVLALEKEVKSLLTEKQVHQRTLATTEDKLEKQRRALDEAKAAVEAKDRVNSQLQQELDRLARSQKQTEAEIKARDTRLQRALEEVERGRKALLDAKTNDGSADGKGGSSKDFVPRKEYERVVNEGRRTVKQKTELLAAFKKQLKLIDVLKRQKMHLEAGRMIAFTEEEFAKACEIMNTGAAASMKAQLR